MNINSVKDVLTGPWREKWIYLLSILSIAVGLFIVALVLVAVYNVHSMAERLPERFSLTVYLKDDISPEEKSRLLEAIRAKKHVRKVNYISKEDAIKELGQALKDSAYLIEGLEANPLPASIELKLRQDYVKKELVKELAQELKAMGGVEDTQYGEQFLGSIQAIMAGVRVAGIAFLTAILLGVLFVCYSTVKILFYRKTDEIETLKLLGASSWFIRMPFLAEGSFIGFMGGVVALLAGYGLFEGFFLGGFSSTVPVLRGVLVPSSFLLNLPISGLIIGFLGALVALGRIRF